MLECGVDPSGPNARFSGNDSDELDKNFRDNSDVFTQKADYLCIREISLQYALPQALLAKIGLKGLVLTLAGNNLHYFTEVIGLSPEVGASVPIPVVSTPIRLSVSSLSDVKLLCDKRSLIRK